MPCTWDGRNIKNDKVVKLAQSESVIPICPEQLGGLPTPRIAQEIQYGGGDDVLDGKCKVLNKNGDDVTKAFIHGAEETLKIAKQMGINEYIGKARSPSCGSGQVYDGSFSGKLVSGDGVIAALLKRNGISITTEEDI